MSSKILEFLRRALVAVLSAPIHVYRYCLSPILPRSCRFEPSCSAYALEALSRHGPVRGSWLTVRRLLRCHPITWLGGRSGFDPVPPR
jgi:putative membrane protein insertion efficiency factor